MKSLLRVQKKLRKTKRKNTTKGYLLNSKGLFRKDLKRIKKVKGNSWRQAKHFFEAKSLAVVDAQGTWYRCNGKA